MRVALLTAAAVLAAPSVTSASHDPGATYSGVIVTGQGGSVTLDVANDGDAVDVSAMGLGNEAGTCTGVSFGPASTPIADHSFSFTSPDGQNTMSGDFGPSSIVGSARSTTFCDTGFQSWRVAGPDPHFGIDPGAGFIGLGIFNRTGTDQTLQLSARRGENANFPLRIASAATENASYEVKGCPSSNDYRVTYSDSTGNVTGPVTDGSYETDVLGVAGTGDFHSLTQKIRPLNSADPGAIKTCKVTAKSSQFVDVIKSNLKVKRG